MSANILNKNLLQPASAKDTKSDVKTFKAKRLNDKNSREKIFSKKESTEIIKSENVKTNLDSKRLNEIASSGSDTDYTKLDEVLVIDKENVRETFVTAGTSELMMQYIIQYTLQRKNDSGCNNCQNSYTLIRKKLVSSCGHNICDECYYKLKIKPCHEFFSDKSKNCHTQKDNVSHRVCPKCQLQFNIIMSDKYVVLCLGEPTDRYKFHNGGFKEIHLCFFPDSVTETYEHVTYEKNQKLTTRIHELVKNNYVIVLQEYTRIEKWFKDLVMSDLLKKYDNKLIRLP